MPYKMLTALAPHAIFGSNFAYYLHLKCLATGVQLGDGTSLSIIWASPGLSVKMVITLEPHSIFLSSVAYLYMTLVCKTMPMLPQASAIPVLVFEKTTTF